MRPDDYLKGKTTIGSFILCLADTECQMAIFGLSGPNQREGSLPSPGALFQSRHQGKP